VTCSLLSFPFTSIHSLILYVIFPIVSLLSYSPYHFPHLEIFPFSFPHSHSFPFSFIFPFLFIFLSIFIFIIIFLHFFPFLFFLSQISRNSFISHIFLFIFYIFHISRDPLYTFQTWSYLLWLTAGWRYFLRICFILATLTMHFHFHHLHNAHNSFYYSLLCNFSNT